VPPGVDTKPFFQLSSWSINGFVEIITGAVEWLKEGSQYELAMEIYSILGIIYKYSRDYDKLVASLNGYKDTAALLLSEVSTRVLPKYFRVAFYGPKTGDFAGKAFIYKVPFHQRIHGCCWDVFDWKTFPHSEMPFLNFIHVFFPSFFLPFSFFQVDAAMSLLALTNRIKNSLATSVKSLDDVVLLPNNPVDPKSIHPDKVYFQIASVSIFGTKGRRVGSGEWGKCDSGEAEIHHNCNQFLFEMSHEKTKKKKMIFCTKTPFPFIKCRVEIVGQQEVILSPIQAAIEVSFYILFSFVCINVFCVTHCIVPVVGSIH
jgi:hypothetical protein